jgi:predicted Kef-type K+ transport protein
VDFSCILSTVGPPAEALTDADMPEQMIEVLSIFGALVLGLAVRMIGLPPMIGFLAAGFVLSGIDDESGQLLTRLADLGVTLLLFTIGCKLDLKSLLRPSIWATASLHMLIVVVVFGGVIFLLGAVGLGRFTELDLRLSLMIAFALSFSSTVFAVKVLEERGEMAAPHGQIAIGILIMQDLIAVVYIAATSGKVPSPWAFTLLALPLLRPVILWLLKQAGHGELLILAGILLTWAGSYGFELVGLKGDLGALAVGVLIAGHPKGEEVAKSLLSFKDFFLVGFFLSIGYKGTPDTAGVAIALLFIAALPLKVGLFFWLLTRFRQRARTAVLTSFTLANYSEFGLIVAAYAESSGWIPGEWLVVIAIALALSFVVSAPVNVMANGVYTRFEQGFKRFEREGVSVPMDLGDAEILIFGMGRVGTGAYEAVRDTDDQAVLGIDSNPEVVAEHEAAGRNMRLGDPSDVDFMDGIASDKIKLVMLALPRHAVNLRAAAYLRKHYDGPIAATAKYDDEVSELEANGITAFNFYSEVGGGLADRACALIEESK